LDGWSERWVTLVFTSVRLPLPLSLPHRTTELTPFFHPLAAKETPPPLPTSRKAVFGIPLAQVADYGFVTSMIAGQRHDLPGVTFSTVEEIYRRGQGSSLSPFFLFLLLKLTFLSLRLQERRSLVSCSFKENLDV
jgi:hypothetical protein